MEDKCITKCYRGNDEKNNTFFVHPFIGLHNVVNDGNAYCIPQYLNLSGTALKKTCDAKTNIDLDIINSLNVPIKPENYIQTYFSLSTLDDVIKYVKNNKDMPFRSKNRIIDFSYLGFGSTFDQDIDKWLILIKSALQKEHQDKIMIKIFKKIFEKTDTFEYPFDLLDKFKKFLDYNI